jgi:Flp pilus assembly pilin Flp
LVAPWWSAKLQPDSADRFQAHEKAEETGLMNKASRRASQRGAAAVEYVGVIALVAALIVTMVVAAPGLGGKVTFAIQTAICRIFGGECPSEATDPFKPKGPCTTATSAKSGDAGLTVFSVHVGGNLEYTRAKRSDGTVAITLKGGGNAGVEFTTPGGHAEAEGGGLKLKEGADASLQALLKGNVANTYVFKNDQEANEFVNNLEQSALDTVNPLKNPLISLSPAAGIANGISGLLGGPHIGGSDFQLPPSEETFVEVGDEVSVKGSIGAGGAGANGGLTGSGVVGAKFNHRTGEKTIYIKVTGSAEGTAGVLFGPGGGAGTEATGLIAVTLDKNNNATNLRVQGEGEIRGGVNVAGSVQNLDELISGIKGAGVKAGDQNGKKYQLTADLDLTDPANAQAAGNLLASIGQGALLGGPGGAVNPDSIQAARDLYQRYDQAGRISFLTYDTSQQNYGFDVGGGEGIKFGVGAGLKFQQGTLDDAYYHIPGVGFVPLTDCK